MSKFRLVTKDGRELHDWMQRKLKEELGQDFIRMTDLSETFSITWKTLKKLRACKGYYPAWQGIKRWVIEDGHRYEELFFTAAVEKSLKGILAYYKRLPGNDTNERAALAAALDKNPREARRKRFEHWCSTF